MVPVRVTKEKRKQRRCAAYARSRYANHRAHRAAARVAYALDFIFPRHKLEMRQLTRPAAFPVESPAESQAAPYQNDRNAA